MSWFGERRYEYEYQLARRVGQIVGRKMVKENTKVVKLRVRPDNELTNWFTSEFLSYTTSYGGWYNHMSRKCFRSELFCGWMWEQSDEIKNSIQPDRRQLLVIRSKYIIIFLNVTDIRVEVWKTIWRLAEKLRVLECIETKREKYV